MEELESKQGLPIPSSEACAHSPRAPEAAGALHRAPFLLHPSAPCTSSSTSLSQIFHPGPGSLWHFPSPQFTKQDHFFFIIYTNILNYFFSNPKYLFLIYGCKYKASRAHISQRVIPVASRAFQT